MELASFQMKQLDVPQNKTGGETESEENTSQKKIPRLSSPDWKVFSNNDELKFPAPHDDL